MSNQKLAEEFHKLIIRKFEKREVWSSFKDNIWGADLPDMQWISKCNKEFWFLWCVINIFSKYTLLLPLKNKNRFSITNVFQKVLSKSGHKRSKIWVDKGREFYNRSVKSWLKDNDIEMHSTNNEEKTVVDERFIEPWKIKYTNLWLQYQKVCILIN